MMREDKQYSSAGFEARNNRLIVALGIVGLLLVAGTFMVGDQIFRRVENEKKEAMYYASENPELLDLRAREKALLESYDWVSQEKKTVRIPIERAMELTAQEAEQ